MTVTFRQPFDLLADAGLKPRNKMAAGADSNGHLSNWLPIVDTYRTFCLAPNPEVHALLDEIRTSGIPGYSGAGGVVEPRQAFP